MDRPLSTLATMIIVISSVAFASMIAGAVGCVSDPNLRTASADGAPSTPNDEGGIIDDVAARGACAASCPGAGGTCDGATCVLSCPGAPACTTTGVACPPGVACHVTCDGKQACASVDCGTATSCKVDCTGESACGNLRGEATTADITCTGRDACKAAMCGGDVCAVQCANEGCKAGEVRCCAKQCTVNGAPGRCVR